MVSAWARRGGWWRPHNQHVQRDTSGLGEGRPILRLLDGRDQRAEDLLGGRWQRGLALLCHLPSAWRRGGCDEWGAPLWGSLGGGGAGTCEARQRRADGGARAGCWVAWRVRHASRVLGGAPLRSWIPSWELDPLLWDPAPLLGDPGPPPFFSMGAGSPSRGSRRGAGSPKGDPAPQRGIQEGNWIPLWGAGRGSSSPGGAAGSPRGDPAKTGGAGSPGDPVPPVFAGSPPSSQEGIQFPKRGCRGNNQVSRLGSSIPRTLRTRN